MTNAHSRLQDTAPHEHGALGVACGVVAGRLTQYADALGCTPAAVLYAVRAYSVPLLNDTGRSKPGEQHERPRDPTLRSLAMTVEAYKQLQAVTRSLSCPTSDHRSHGPVRLSKTLRPRHEPEKTMPETAKKIENVKVRMSPALRAAIEREAQREGRSVSGYMRRLARRDLEVKQRIFSNLPPTARS